MAQRVEFAFEVDDASTLMSTRRAVVCTSIAVLAISALLQLWRPFFYLTDDSFSGFLPSAVEFCRRLWAGDNPFISLGVYGGEFDTRNDPGVIGLVGPWMLLFSWLALTPYYYVLVDVVSICNSLCIAASFCWSACWILRRFHIALPLWILVAMSVSYTFTPFNLLVGSSWIGFLNAQVALPLVLVGCLHPSFRISVALQTGGLLYALLGGHAHPLVMLCAFAGILSVMIAWTQHRIAPVAATISAGLIMALVASPLLLAAFHGFSGAGRAAGVALVEANALRMEPALLTVSAVLGPLASLVSMQIGAYSVWNAMMFSLAYSAANMTAMIALMAAVRQRKLHALSVPLGLLLTLSLLMVARPAWLGAVLLHVPLIRSLRWPFRELWVASFALHMLVLLNIRLLSVREVRLLLVAGALAMSAMLVSPPPTLYPFKIDRRLIVSGAAEAHWRGLLDGANSRVRIVVGVDSLFLLKHRDEIPFTLIGAYNFGCLFNFTSESGYTIFPPVRPIQDDVAVSPIHTSGVLRPEDAMRVQAKNPAVWLVTLEGVRPAQWSVKTGERVRRFRYDEPSNSVIETTR